MTLPESDSCPLCNEPAWPTWRDLDAFAATCGTTWHGTTIHQSPQCNLIASLRLELALTTITRTAA